MSPTRDAVSQLVARLKAALDTSPQGSAEDVRARLRRLEAEASALGLSSAYLTWLVADTYLASKRTAELERGFALSCRALQADPMQPAHLQQFAQFVQKLRARLEAHGRGRRQRHVPRLYETLLRVGEADARCHVVMARYLMRRECWDEAKQLLDATVLLAPGHKDAWVLRAQLARRLGVEAEAEACDRRVAELALAPRPFAVPTPATRC